MILLVDDRQENLFSLRTVLEQHGFQTDTALSGEEALKKLLRTEYALIILDVQMPGMDGFEVAEAVTGLNKTRDIPIIFLSAVNTHKRFITRGFESGAVDYLTKPVDPDILILKVRNFYRLFEKTQALKQAEKALTATVKELHLTLESLPQLAFTADGAGRLEFVNQHWLDYALSSEDFPIARIDLQQFWKENIGKGEPFEKEIAICRIADGLYYHHLLRVRPVVIHGLIQKWVGTFTSIHEQKMLSETLEKKVAERTVELLEANRALEISNHDLQQFTSVASHDLKEPLRKIQFYGNLIRERAELKEAIATYLEKIIQSSARMSGLINDLLSFASLSGPNHFEPADLNVILGEICSDLELAIEEKKAVIDAGALPVIDAVPGLIRQLFQNLISNALKFTRPGEPPVVTIRSELIQTPSIEAKPVSQGRYCRISIADNGIGFDEKYGDRIFHLFQRLNARAEYEGTGIGLAIARKIVDRHHGTIAARSKPGEGSVFYVILPLEQEGAQGPAEKSLQVPPYTNQFKP